MACLEPSSCNSLLTLALAVAVGEADEGVVERPEISSSSSVPRLVRLAQHRRPPLSACSRSGPRTRYIKVLGLHEHVQRTGCSGRCVPDGTACRAVGWESVQASSVERDRWRGMGSMQVPHLEVSTVHADAFQTRLTSFSASRWLCKSLVGSGRTKRS